MCERSIVEYFSGHEGYRCGYCKSDNTCYSHGMWAHAFTPADYQNLIDRGWRRSGKYCYKPTMHLTCCPQYTIRCEAKKFTLSKSQKKVLKKVHKFLAYGEQQKAEPSEDRNEQLMEVSEFPQALDMQSLKNIKKVKDVQHDDMTVDESDNLLNTNDVQNPQCGTSSSSVPLPSGSSPSVSAVRDDSPPLKQSNLDPNKPPSRKAKVIRRERKLQKLLKLGISPEEAAASMAKKNKNNQPKSIEDFIYEPIPSEPAHKLELRLVPSEVENSRFCQTFQDSLSVYKKYQTSIHKDPAEKCSGQHYTRFLVNSPFQHYDDSSPRSIYGSFHQQYWLDGKLIAVGVIDILPQCVSSVYFYYDPDYSFLSLGTYAALREIAFTRELSLRHPELQYYYMGFYIHSCVKMSYKGQYSPSYLLCPETYIFQPIEKCRPKLSIAKYHRLEEDLQKEDCDGVVNLKEVLILYDKRQMTYPTYRSLNTDQNDEDVIREYAGFVGRKCYRRILLYRNS